MDENQSGKDTELANYTRPNRIHAISHFFLALGIFLLMAVVLGLVGVYIGLSMLDMKFADAFDPGKMEELMMNGNALRIMNFFSSSLSLILAAILFCLFIRADTGLFLLLKQKPEKKWFLLSLLFFLSAIPLMGPLLTLNGYLDIGFISESIQEWLMSKELQNNKLYEQMSKDQSMNAFWLNMLFMAFFPALAEEFFFRSLLVNVFQGIFRNIHVAIILSGFLFTAIHLQVYKTLPMMLLAISFGYMVYWSGSVWPAVIAHFLNNATAVISMKFFTGGDYSELLQQDQSMPWFIVAISLIVFVFLFYFLQKNASPKLSNFYV